MKHFDAIFMIYSGYPLVQRLHMKSFNGLRRTRGPAGLVWGSVSICIGL